MSVPTLNAVRELVYNTVFHLDCGMLTTATGSFSQEYLDSINYLLQKDGEDRDTYIENLKSYYKLTSADANRYKEAWDAAQELIASADRILAGPFQNVGSLNPVAAEDAINKLISRIVDFRLEYVSK